MNNKLTWKTIIIVLVVGFSLYKLYPNFLWYSLPIEERQEQAKRKNPLVREVIPLGLDLQGGVHLVYQLDLSKLPDVSDETVHRAIDQNMIVINNRIDGLGVANAFVARQGREFIVIQMPGVYGSEEAKSIIGKTALLEFRLVKDDEALVKILDEVSKKGVRPEDVVSGRLPEEIKKLLPAGTQLLPQREGGYLLVTDKAELTGKYLKQARVEMGNSMTVGGLSIGFELDAEGATLFEALTSAHINDRLAIVLDSMIQSAPRIESRIPGGRGQITGSFNAQEAKTLANILNSGNLQAPMSVVEERTVGPELGEDSIRAGAKAMLVGFSLVILFMVIYYKFSGLLADAALLLQIIILFAIMTWIKATMTMPGIAGVILSLAMSVDANVIIMERIREELALGKDVKYAIEEGYDKAFSAIWDGNVTAILAAAFLFQFGTGPVKGFGITLMLGLAISMFTCVFATKIFYDVWVFLRRPKTLSI
ncbi:MAG: Protein translocase subunit SecD [Elusimicrobia bacterium]|nr:Protein translocase subunit SecD [Elusimicrobiota bacterium]